MIGEGAGMCVEGVMQDCGVLPALQLAMPIFLGRTGHSGLEGPLPLSIASEESGIYTVSRRR